jgi:hypothetical protein
MTYAQNRVSKGLTRRKLPIAQNKEAAGRNNLPHYLTNFSIAFGAGVECQIGEIYISFVTRKLAGKW